MHVCLASTASIVILLLGGSGPAPPATRADRKDSDGFAAWVGATAGRRLAVQWEGIPAAEALADLANRLGQPIWTSDDARHRARTTRVRLVVRHLTGFQALSALCRLAGLDWTWTEGVIAVTASSRTPSGWRMGSLVLRARILREHPQWARAHAGKPTANLDLVDATASAAIARVSDAYELNLWLPEAVRKRQGLITLQARSMPVAEAVAELARQLGTRPVEADGVVWLLSDDLLESFGSSQPTTAPAGEARTPAGPKRKWTTLRAGAVTAEGWSDEITAVRRWREQHTDAGDGRTQDARTPEPRRAGQTGNAVRDEDNRAQGVDSP